MLQERHYVPFLRDNLHKSSRASNGFGGHCPSVWKRLDS